MGRADDNFPLWEWFPTSFSFSLFKLPLSSVYYAGVSIILINLFVNRFLTLIVCLRSLHAYFDPHKMLPPHNPEPALLADYCMRESTRW